MNDTRKYDEAKHRYMARHAKERGASYSMREASPVESPFEARRAAAAGPKSKVDARIQHHGSHESDAVIQTAPERATI